MSNFLNWLDFYHKNSVSARNYNEKILLPLHDFQQEFDSMFKKFCRSLPNPIANYLNLNINPSLDIVEDESLFKVELEMPGVDEKNIKVSINDNVLHINASKENSKKDEGKNYIMREIYYGSYERSIPLPDNIDVENAESTFKKGMLWVSIPKKAIDKSKIRELEIKKSD